MRYLGETSAANEDGAYRFDEIVQGIDIRGQIRPFRHGARGSEEPREQHDAYHEEPHHEDCLLHGVAIV